MSLLLQNISSGEGLWLVYAETRPHNPRDRKFIVTDDYDDFMLLVTGQLEESISLRAVYYHDGHWAAYFEGRVRCRTCRLVHLLRCLSSPPAHDYYREWLPDLVEGTIRDWPFPCILRGVNYFAKTGVPGHTRDCNARAVHCSQPCVC